MENFESRRCGGYRLQAIVALLAAILGCGPSSAPAAAPEQLDLAWVVLDAAGASHFGLYGYPRNTTPNIDSLAAESAVFERAYAQFPITTSSTGSFLTGLYPHTAVKARRLIAPSIATLLAPHGYRSAAFSENPWVRPSLGFARDFETFELRASMEGASSGQRDTTTTIDRALSWIEASPSRPFLLYLHLLPPHTPYNPPEPFAGRFRAPGQSPHWKFFEVTLGQRDYTADELRSAAEIDLRELPESQPDIELIRAAYDENLSYVDHQVGRLIAGLRSRDLLEHTIVVVTADHGEAFGEHEELFHGSSLYAEQIHVPLLIRLPAALPPARGRFDSVVELCDLVPTLLDLLEIEAPELDGRSLRPVLYSKGSTDSVARAWLEVKHLASVQRGDTKLIVGGDEPLLFDLASDPGETVNLARDRPELVEEMLGHLDAVGADGSATSDVEIDPKTRKELEALGYSIER